MNLSTESLSLFLLLKRAGKEASLILFATILLGLSYSYVMKRGFFSPSKHLQTIPHTNIAPAFISYEEAIVLFNARTALFVDARHDYDFKLGHIKGAISAPLKDFNLTTSPLVDVSRNTTIITYCDGAECNSSIELAKVLSEAGFIDVRMFFGGWNEWRQHGGATEIQP
jgi:rhodanese-related sulfurtransferase